MEPGFIKKLDEAVVNRIAAGEIIQRPANALKELIENSLDAKATYIAVSAKAGGLKLLQIQDNGTGIRKDNLDIVCERFTTSKLERFEDLSSIATFGFRGEALSSISHVARLHIQTKTAQDNLAYKASYEDGILQGEPKPCPGNQGTTITVEDLFYNVPQRRQALRNPNGEFQKILDVIMKYAIHNSHVGFTLKKVGENITVRTQANKSCVDNIRSLYGKSIADELIHIHFKDETYQFKIDGYITNVNYSGKTGIMLLFINHRLVESQNLKSAIDSVYSTYLPKGTYPFMYLSLEIEPTIIDVNVHPTKHEVHFLHEDDIIEKIKSHVEMKLLGSNSARNHYKETHLPKNDKLEKSSREKSANSSQILPQTMVRTDAKEQKLEKFFKSIQEEGIFENISPNIPKLKKEIVKRKETKLTSILDMRKRIEKECSSELRRTIKDMTFVGVINKQYSLFQFETKLYLCDTISFSEALCSQLLIYNFENLNSIAIEPSLSLRELSLIALDCKESEWTEEDGPKDELADKIVEVLVDKAKLLDEYFNFKITCDGMLETLPLLIENHTPSLCRLPIYLLRLATEVNWETEVECFKTFTQETANFYAYVADTEEGTSLHKWTVEHAIYPALKQYLIPSRKLKPLIELTNLPRLYKVFERC